MNYLALIFLSSLAWADGVPESHFSCHLGAHELADFSVDVRGYPGVRDITYWFEREQVFAEGAVRVDHFLSIQRADRVNAPPFLEPVFPNQKTVSITKLIAFRNFLAQSRIFCEYFIGMRERLATHVFDFDRLNPLTKNDRAVSIVNWFNEDLGIKVLDERHELEAREMVEKLLSSEMPSLYKNMIHEIQLEMRVLSIPQTVPYYYLIESLYDVYGVSAKSRG